MTDREWMRPVLYGAAACALLLGVYAAALMLVSGEEFLRTQFAQYWYFVLALAVGFGVQVGLYTRLRQVTRHDGASGKVVAVSGGTSTAAMISCCTHYVANVLPVLGATGLVALVAQYQTELFWVGLAFSLAGVVYVGRKLAAATRHMAQMESQT
jgi:P-type Cu+ transporter